MVNLLNNQVTYLPAVHTDVKNGLRWMLGKWLEGFLKIGTLVKRLDLGEGTYVRELQEDMLVAGGLARSGPSS